MKPFRLLLFCTIAAAAAHAQAGTAPLPPQLATRDSRLTVPAIKPPRLATQVPAASLLSLGKPIQLPPALAAKDTAPCYSLRSYTFPAGDLHSAAPRPSSESTCLHASSTRLKAIQLSAPR